jgi:hypothetical protein
MFKKLRFCMIANNVKLLSQEFLMWIPKILARVYQKLLHCLTGSPIDDYMRIHRLSSGLPVLGQSESAMRKSSKSIFGSAAVASPLVLVAAIGSVACEASNIRPCRTDLKPEARKVISETYGADAIPKRSQFGGFVSLLFVSGKALVVIGIANSDGGYALQEVATGFPVRPEGENEMYLLLASPGRHYVWDGNRVDLTGPASILGHCGTPNICSIGTRMDLDGC